MEFLKTLFGRKYTRDNFFLLAGPCVVENREILFETAGVLKELCEELEIHLVFKSSFCKANRSSISSFTGIGRESALALLAEVREKFEIPIVTDIHTEEEAEIVVNYVDVL